MPVFSCVKILVSLLFVAVKDCDPYTHFLNFSLLAFYSIATCISSYNYCLHNKSICPCFQVPKNLTGAYLIMFLQALVNKSANMAKQLYYSKTHSKNIEIYLSKLAI